MLSVFQQSKGTFVPFWVTVSTPWVSKAAVWRHSPEMDLGWKGMKWKFSAVEHTADLVLLVQLQLSLERDLENLLAVTHRVPESWCVVGDIGDGPEEGKKDQIWAMPLRLSRREQKGDGAKSKWWWSTSELLLKAKAASTQFLRKLAVNYKGITKKHFK